MAKKQCFAFIFISSNNALLCKAELLYRYNIFVYIYKSSGKYDWRNISINYDPMMAKSQTYSCTQNRSTAYDGSDKDNINMHLNWTGNAIRCSRKRTFWGRLVLDCLLETRLITTKIRKMQCHSDISNKAPKETKQRDVQKTAVWESAQAKYFQNYSPYTCISKGGAYAYNCINNILFITEATFHSQWIRCRLQKSTLSQNWIFAA